MSDRVIALRREFERAGQGHVFAFWPELNDASRARFARELAAVDLALVGRLARRAREKDPAPGRFEAPEVFPLRRDPRQAQHAERARRVGEEWLSAGRVGYLLVAGGQASRLGFDGPKGAFEVGPVTRASLFEFFARRLLAARQRFGAHPCWYVMTSQANDAETREFFVRHRWFGLAEADVVFFAQAMLPALDHQGKILLAARDALFLAPNGHGGVLAALAESGGLEHAKSRGVRCFSYFQVDNPLARPADPLFLGLHASTEAEMSSKVVAKRDAGEKVGVLGQVDGRLSCIEYSDLPNDLREARHPDGSLVFGAGNIAMHVLDLPFVERLTNGGLELPWHVARKQVTALDAAGHATSLAGTKFETFVFDALAFVRRSVILEVDRAEEFSPVKNHTGEDSPATARADLCRLHAGWVAAAGLALPPRNADGVVPVEVDPRLAEDRATFVAAMPRAPEIRPTGHYYR